MENYSEESSETDAEMSGDPELDRGKELWSE